MTTSTQTQFRRGTSTQVGAMTPALGELVVNTTNKRVHQGDGSTAGGIPLPNYLDIIAQAFSAPTVGGTGNAITLTNAAPITAYAAPQKFVFKATAANTAAVQVNVDGKGLKDIKKISSGALAALAPNDIIVGGNYEITYDGTQFQIELSSGANSGAGKFVQIQYGLFTGTTDTNSNTFVDTGLSVAITPTSASNNILVFAALGIGADSASDICMLQLVRASTAIGLGASASTRTPVTAAARPANSSNLQSVTLLTVDSPATTSPTTYKAQFLSVLGGVNAVHVNRTGIDTDIPSLPRGASTIVAIEIAP